MIEKVKELTGLSVNMSQVLMAKSIVEAYIGRLQEELSDKDTEWFIRCVAYQTKYMSENDVMSNGYKTVRQDDSTVSFNANYALSPLVIQTAKNFSFNTRISQISLVPFLDKSDSE